MRKAAPWASAAMMLCAVVGISAGGWCVVTVTDLPDHVVAGQPVTLTYAVRQHGRTLLGNLEGRVTATAAGQVVAVASKPAGEEGHYTATLTLPDAGEWTIAIESGFIGPAAPRVPLLAVEPGAAAPAASASAQGRRLFAAKGCVTCHVDISVGPNLTAKAYQPEYLRKVLANPRKAVRSRTEGYGMPDLRLRPPEIASIVAYITASRDTAMRGPSPR